MLFDEKSHYTVTELNAEIRSLVEEEYPDVSVVGEVSNLKQHSSGHVYFTLKDSDSQLRSVCFRRDAEQIDFDLKDGMQVIVHGRLTLYEAYGQYQIIIYKIEVAGVGKLELAFRALCDRLEKEGLFDPEHKTQPPAYPFKIAVVTSPTGAAVEDIASTIRRRWPCAAVYLFPVRVQGDQATDEIVRALQLLPQLDGLDVIILGRGGGSLEDLWCFNEESVARAIFDCPIPIISAVGHETDVTIADFVADVRAATPTMAAEVAVPNIEEVWGNLDAAHARLIKLMATQIELKKGRLQEMLRSYALRQIRGRIERLLQSIDYTMEKLSKSTHAAANERKNRLTQMVTRLHGLDVRAVLSRGYALCTDAGSEKVISSAANALQAGNMRVTFGDGSVRTRVEERSDEPVKR